MGLAAAVQLGLLPGAALEKGRAHSAWQLRAFLRTPRGDALCKGMLRVNPAIEGIHLRRSCIKLERGLGSSARANDAASASRSSGDNFINGEVLRTIPLEKEAGCQARDKIKVRLMDDFTASRASATVRRRQLGSLRLLAVGEDRLCA